MGLLYTALAFVVLVGLGAVSLLVAVLRAAYRTLVGGDNEPLTRDDAQASPWPRLSYRVRLRNTCKLNGKC